MAHIFVLQLIISGGAALVVLALYYLYSFFNPSERLALFLRLQVFVVIIVFINIFHAYNLSDLGARQELQSASYCLSFLWAPGFLYFTALFYMNIAKQEASPGFRRTVFILSLALGALSFLPLLHSRGVDQVLVEQKWIQRHVIIPCCGMTQVGFSVFFYIKALGRSYRNHKIMSLCLMVMNLVIMVACILTMWLSPAPSRGAMEPYLVVLDYYFLVWNALALAFIFGLSPLILRKRKDALKAKLAPGAPADPGLARDWRLIEGAVVGKGLFRNSDLDLSLLSRTTGIPRNRISLVVNSVTGKSFHDYVNMARIEEFKRLASSRDFAGNILTAAFDAGFNSKATFYNWIKKGLGESPSDYIRRLRE